MSRWRELAKIVGAFTVAAASLAFTVRSIPSLQAAVIGAFVGAIIVAGVSFLAVADGSLLARLGRMLEGDVGDELRRTRGVFGVISGVSFEGFDVDHVVLARKGCYAVEVKGLFGRRQRLDDTYELAAKTSQARRGAEKVQRLLRSRGVDLTVMPVLVLAGPGAPRMHGVTHVDGVLVAAFRDSDDWRPRMAAPGGAVNIITARRAAEELLAFGRERAAHERRTERTGRRGRFRPEAVPGGERPAALPPTKKVHDRPSDETRRTAGPPAQAQPTPTASGALRRPFRLRAPSAGASCSRAALPRVSRLALSVVRGRR